MNKYLIYIIGFILTLCQVYGYPPSNNFNVRVRLVHSKISDEQVQDEEPIEVKQDNSQMTNSTLADKLYNEVKVLCWVMTYPENHQKKAIHIKNTWGRRCNKILYMSTSNDTELGTIALPVGEGRNNLWGKTKEAFKYIYKNHYNDYDWFLKADDDTYVIVENLRYMLYPYSPKTPIYFGCKFNAIVDQGYMSGGAGYVLSKEALRRFIEEALPNKELCRQDNDGAEDAEIGKCLENVKVIAGDSRDSEKKGTFFPFNVETQVTPGPVDKSFWGYYYQYYKTHQGMNCCSDYAVSFHYTTPAEMYAFEYLIYHLKPYGVLVYPRPLPEKIPIDQVKVEMIRRTTTVKPDDESKTDKPNQQDSKPNESDNSNKPVKLNNGKLNETKVSNDNAIQNLKPNQSLEAANEGKPVKPTNNVKPTKPLKPNANVTPGKPVKPSGSLNPNKTDKPDQQLSLDSKPNESDNSNKPVKLNNGKLNETKVSNDNAIENLKPSQSLELITVKPTNNVKPTKPLKPNANVTSGKPIKPSENKIPKPSENQVPNKEITSNDKQNPDNIITPNENNKPNKVTNPTISNANSKPDNKPIIGNGNANQMINLNEPEKGDKPIKVVLSNNKLKIFFGPQFSNEV